MKAKKVLMATGKRWCALQRRSNRGFDLTCHKRNRLNDHATQQRHCAQYLTNALRRGLVMGNL